MSNVAATEATLQRSDSTIHYWLYGPENAPLVAFTHGASMDHRMFYEQVAAVAKQGYRVLVWDIRGHGLSKPVGENFSLSTVTEDLRAIIDLLGYETVVLVGQSFGGYVSQEFVFRYPERVEALVVVGSTCITVAPTRLEALALKLSTLMFSLWPEGNLKKLIARNTAVKPGVRSYAYEAAQRLSKTEFMRVWKAVTNCQHEEPHHRISRPFLLTHGEHDRAGNIAKTAPEWAGRELDCIYQVIPDAGHNANQDNPGFFNRVLVEFLKERTSA